LEGWEVLKAVETAVGEHEDLKVIELLDEFFEFGTEFAYFEVAELQTQDFCLFAFGLLNDLPDLRHHRHSVFDHFGPP
jgi:hypothetical protein